MLNSTALEVAVGLVFCYCAVSLIVSSINEAIASVLGLRAATLLTGVKSLLNDPEFDGLARDVYNHALVNPRSGGKVQKEEDLSRKPSYIPSNHFANALIDVLQRTPAAAVQLDKAIAAIQDPQLRQLLLGMYARAAGDVEKLRHELAGWFDNGMERVAGQYKRRTQLNCFLIGLIIAALFNIDSFHLFKTLWENPAFAAALTASSSQNVTNAFQGLQTLPIGWISFPNELLPVDWSLIGAGWLVTASSVLFGAPFWFDLLQNFAQIRGTGRKPNVPS